MRVFRKFIYLLWVIQWRRYLLQGDVFMELGRLNVKNIDVLNDSKFIDWLIEVFFSKKVQLISHMSCNIKNGKEKTRILKLNLSFGHFKVKIC